MEIHLMNKVMQEVKSFLEDEEGLTVVEYAVAGGLISIAVVGAFSALGDEVCGVIDRLTNAIQGLDGDAGNCI
jgi:pilus assembly protein Flp/PilA